MRRKVRISARSKSRAEKDTLPPRVKLLGGEKADLLTLWDHNGSPSAS